MTQPEALRLADIVERNSMFSETAKEAAAELRRLHAENEGLWKEREEPHKTIEMYVSECNRLESERDALKAQRDALLEALKLARSIIGHPDDAHTQMIDAAIKAVEEGK